MSISSIFAAPSYLWNSYLHYLWNYDSNSWVANIAYAFRIWAIFTILPTLVLGLLDVTSYIIARTLGDPTASTSHKSSFATQPHANSEHQIPNTNADTSQTIPTVPVPIPIAVFPPNDRTPPSGASTKPSTPARGGGLSTPSLPTFFVDGECSEDDGAARLAGVGVFSPVASMPGSPVASRRNFLEREAEEEEVGSGSEESGSSAARGVQLRGGLGRKRDEAEEQERGGHEKDGGSGHERSASDGTGWTNGGGSTSGESSFAMLDREESFEDAGAHIRRRAPGTASADE